MNTKQLSFNYQLEKEGITLEVNFEGTDNEVSFPEMIEPDSAEPYEAELKSVIFNGQNILPILEHLKATDIIWNEAVKVAWSEFNS
jgi:hypothetical protein